MTPCSRISVRAGEELACGCSPRLKGREGVSVDCVYTVTFASWYCGGSTDKFLLALPVVI